MPQASSLEIDLVSLGWNESLAAEFARSAPAGCRPARVIAFHGSIVSVLSEEGESMAHVPGSFRERPVAERPVVGDWVALEPGAGTSHGVMREILPRRSSLSRKVAGEETVEQVVAANIDTVFLVAALDRDYSVRRLERTLAMVWDCGARPVIVLTKPDCCDDVPGRVVETEEIAPGVPVHVAHPPSGEGCDALEPYVARGLTAVLLGSSGVGKSTLVNALAGEEICRTAEVRELDGKGRHTTTQRELIRLPDRGLVIDSPGVRELQLWETGEGIYQTFTDVEELAEKCRFDDCSHQLEPGCAVKKAVADRELDMSRFASYQKLQRERRHLEERRDVRAQLDQKRRNKTLSRAIRRYHKHG